MNVRRKIVAAVFLLVATFASAQTVEYIHTDALGSPVAVTNASGTVIERTVYEPYGAVLNRPLNNRPGYTGHVEDAVTGLNYMQQRYYDPQVGRFLSIDPVTATNAGENFNRYWYANNNPYNYTDPDGQWGMLIFARPTPYLGPLRVAPEPVPPTTVPSAVRGALNQAARQPSVGSNQLRQGQYESPAAYAQRLMRKPENLTALERAPEPLPSPKYLTLRDGLWEFLSQIFDALNSRVGTVTITELPPIEDPSDQTAPPASPVDESHTAPSQQPQPPPQVHCAAEMVPGCHT